MYTSLITGSWVHTSLVNHWPPDHIIQTSWRIYNQKHTLTQFRHERLISRLDHQTSGVLPLALGPEQGPAAQWLQSQYAAAQAVEIFLFSWRCDVVVLYRVGLGWRSFENNLLGWRFVTLIVEKVLPVSVVHHGYFPYYRYKEILFVAIVPFIILILSWFLIFIKDQ